MNPRDINMIVNFLLYAPFGSRLTIKDKVVIKDVHIEDLGYTRIHGQYYLYDDGRIGKKIKAKDVKAQLREVIETEPDAFFSS